MLNILGFIASVNVALECAGRAMGLVEQALLPDGSLWLWWVISAGWICAALSFLREAVSGGYRG